jgi:uracil-DNA glycosylase
MDVLGLGPRWVARTASGPASGTGAGHAEPDTSAAGAARHRESAPPPADDRSARILRMDWTALEAEVETCTACALAPTRTRTVFGVGDRSARWLFVGEGPGAEEDQRGEPFVGQAGRLLDNMLASIGIARGNGVYIANIVKCRPPGNRNPEAAEAQACSAFLRRQVDLIQPSLVVALGKIAATNLLGRDVPVGSLRGRVHEYRGVPLVVTYHPAYLLRNLPDKAKAWEDLCFARDTMTALAARRTSEAVPDAP